MQRSVARRRLRGRPRPDRGRLGRAGGGTIGTGRATGTTSAVRIGRTSLTAGTDVAPRPVTPQHRQAQPGHPQRRPDHRGCRHRVYRRHQDRHHREHPPTQERRDYQG